MAKTKKGKGKDKEEEASTEVEAKSSRGRSIILPGGEKRADYIRRRYYDDEISRSDIAKELTEMTGNTVAYQIVFAATKLSKEDYAKTQKAADK